MVLSVKIDLACGNHKKAGCLGLDKAKLSGVDVVCDLGKAIPLRSGSVDEAHCYWFYEHVPDILRFTEELWRVMKPGAHVFIKVPYYVSFNAFKDPTHVNFFTYDTFTYFTDENEYSFYSKARFEIVRRYLSCSDGPYWLRRLIRIIVNRMPSFYEHYLNKFMRCEWMDVELKKK